MTVMPFSAAPTLHIETLEGDRLGVSRVRHPASGVQCLSFTGPEGRRVALVPSKAIMDVRQRVWRVASTTGTYTLGPVDMAMLRKLAA
jgi:hypothetical protein